MVHLVTSVFLAVAAFSALCTAEDVVASCDEFSFANTTLNASCEDATNSTVVETSIDLRTCVGDNTHGQLQCSHSGGDSLASCSGCKILSPSEGNLTLSCSSCPNQFGNYAASSVNLDECLTNNNGTLACTNST
ncbi:hypothetical protein SCLCIDRAFT_1223751 [Scleroderma citrinum Foug A]|uniref:Cyanovirin-N domain-containing protein n=1 Tax=Scleroderma citrinum Foug A TaxID=1036808 RepID=A0A0C2ZHX5_9AGAM|nr:hypothetical protein SCLCIDRAFT_1223751 [Scleroderma citrinum Foug A]